MGLKRVINVPNVSGWAISSGVANAAHTVTVDLPVGPRYHMIRITGNAGTAKKMDDLIGDIRIKINGKVQRVHSAKELNTINVLNGAQYAGYLCNTAAGLFNLPIFFAEPWRKNLATQDALAWGTGDVSTFQLEVDIKASTFTAPVALTVKAVVDNSLVSVNNRNIDQPLGAIVKWGNTQINAATGWNDFMGFPRNDLYQSIHVIDANLTEFEIKAENDIIRQDTQAGNRAFLQAHDMYPLPTADGNFEARTGYQDIVFDHDDMLGSALPMQFGGRRLNSFNVRLNTTAANIKAIYQVLGPAD